jgi:hypothetical protein
MEQLKLHNELKNFTGKITKDKKELGTLKKDLESVLREFKKGKDVNTTCRAIIKKHSDLNEIFIGSGSHEPSPIVVILIILFLLIAANAY